MNILQIEASLLQFHCNNKIIIEEKQSDGLIFTQITIKTSTFHIEIYLKDV